MLMRRREGINLFSMEERKRYLMMHGQNSIAFSTIQQGMSYYDIDEIGYIAFKETFLSRIHILGDPVADAKHYEALTVGLAKSKRIASASQINKAFALMLESKGYFINRSGIESIVDTSQFTLNGKNKQNLRSAKNTCTKENVSVVRFNPEQHGRDELRDISIEWLKSKRNGARELSFLTRPMLTPLLSEVEILIGIKESQIIGFVMYDPIYKDKRTIGYTASVLRQRINAPSGLLDFINLEKIRRMKEEGIKVFSLGWSPLAGLSRYHRQGESQYTHQILRLSYEHLNIFYAYKDLAFHKERYRPHTKPVFFAYDTRLPIVNLTEQVWISRIYSPANTLHNLIRFARKRKSIKEQIRQAIRYISQKVTAQAKGH